MADKPHDDPSKRDSYGKHFKRAVTAGHNDWRFAAPMVALPLLIGLGFSTPALLETPRPQADENLLTGIFDQHKDYSYTGFEDENGREQWYLLLEQGGIPRVYERHATDNTRLLLVSDPVRAKEIIQQNRDRLQASIDNFRANIASINPIEEQFTNTATCEYVTVPFAYGGGIERYKDGCPHTRVAGHQFEEHQAQELALWDEAFAALEANPTRYGPQSGEITTLQQQTQIGYFFDESAELSFALLGLWMAGTAGMAGVSYTNANRRRRDSKTPR